MANSPDPLPPVTAFAASFASSRNILSAAEASFPSRRWEDLARFFLCAGEVERLIFRFFSDVGDFGDLGGRADAELRGDDCGDGFGDDYGDLRCSGCGES